MDGRDVIIIVSAHNEADRIGATVVALREAFDGARIVVADDGSTDATAQAAGQAGAEVVTSPRNVGKGGATTLAAQRVLRRRRASTCCATATSAETAGQLTGLVDAVRDGSCDLAVGAFAARARRRLRLRRRLRAVGDPTADGAASCERRSAASARCAREVLDAVVPFAPRFGMEIGMTVDAARAGFTVRELPLELTHRATGRTLGGFRHRARQLADFLLVTATRLRRRTPR